MDIYTFLTLLAFFLTTIVIVAMISNQTQLAEKAIDGLIKLPKSIFLQNEKDKLPDGNTTQPSTD